MSSHHIVRENQEPALLVLDVDTIDADLLGQLLEWSPIVMTTQRNIPYFLAHQINVDLVFSITDAPLTESSQQIDVVYTTPDQLLERCFAYLSGRGQTALYILTPDPSFSELMKYLDRFRIVVLSDNTRYTITTSYEKWLPAGTHLLIECGEEKSVSTKGLAKVGHRRYVTASDGFVTVTHSNDPYIIIGEKL